MLWEALRSQQPKQLWRQVPPTTSKLCQVVSFSGKPKQAPVHTRRPTHPRRMMKDGHDGQEELESTLQELMLLLLFETVRHCIPQTGLRV